VWSCAAKQIELINGIEQLLNKDITFHHASMRHLSVEITMVNKIRDKEYSITPANLMKLFRRSVHAFDRRLPTGMHLGDNCGTLRKTTTGGSTEELVACSVNSESKTSISSCIKRIYQRLLLSAAPSPSAYYRRTPEGLELLRGVIVARFS
jgi:hypothetical protein